MTIKIHRTDPPAGITIIIVKQCGNKRTRKKKKRFHLNGSPLALFLCRLIGDGRRQGVNRGHFAVPKRTPRPPPSLVDRETSSRTGGVCPMLEVIWFYMSRAGDSIKARATASPVTVATVLKNYARTGQPERDVKGEASVPAVCTRGTR